MQNTNKIFVDENEKEIATLGGSYLQNFLNTGDLSKGFCVVSDKRVYFKGKNYYKSGGFFRGTKDERTVDLKDITGTGFSVTRNLTLFVLWLLSICWTIFVVITTMTYFESLQAFIAFIPPAVMTPLYLILKTRLFEVEFAGGKLAFKASSYSEDEMQNFQRLLRTAKDNFESVRNTPVNHVSASTGDELKKYKELLDSGAISEEEYKILKQKVMN